MAKATMATLKSFVRKNEGKLLISTKSCFDGMIDGVRNCENQGFTPVVKADENMSRVVDNFSRTLGIQGAWFVGSSRDHITPFEENGIKGFEISNCCGRFSLGVKV